MIYLYLTLGFIIYGIMAGFMFKIFDQIADWDLDNAVVGSLIWIIVFPVWITWFAGSELYDYLDYKIDDYLDKRRTKQEQKRRFKL